MHLTLHTQATLKMLRIHSRFDEVSRSHEVDASFVPSTVAFFPPATSPSTTRTPSRLLVEEETESGQSRPFVADLGASPRSRVTSASRKRQLKAGFFSCTFRSRVVESARRLKTLRIPNLYFGRRATVKGSEVMRPKGTIQTIIWNHNCKVGHAFGRSLE